MTMMINVRFGPYLVALSAPVTPGQLWTAAAASAAAVAVATMTMKILRWPTTAARRPATTEAVARRTAAVLHG